MQQELKNIPINQIDVEENYRKTFDEKKLAELARSIRKNGVIQPIVVRKKGKRYSLVAGERRLRASKLADQVTIPSVIRTIDEQAYAIELQLIENIQKEQVPYMEEAYGFARLREAGILDVKEIAERIGKSDQYIYVALQLTRMADDARRIAEHGWISKGVAWEIAKLKDPDQQNQAANDLARTKSDKMISVSGAKKYIETTFGDGKRRLKKERVAKFGRGSQYIANWKKYLVSFTADEFERFKQIVRGRTDTEVLAEAVDLVMRRSNEGDLAKAMEA
ncbi:MAG: ParB/RepB/Spo0J family partition protein [Hyphomonadaceae bacterium]